MEKKEKPLKYIKNKIDISKISDQEFYIQAQDILVEKLNEFESVIQTSQSIQFTSSQSELKDPFLYVGSGGNIYVYWRLYLMSNKQTPDKIYLDKAIEALQTNLSFFQSEFKHSKSKISIAFLGGPVGLYTLGALLFNEKGDDKQVLKYVQNVISLYQPNSYREEDELIYGRAGYLYSLLLLRNISIKDIQSQLDSTIIQVVKDLIQSGEVVQSQDKQNILIWRFPKKDGKRYLGAAHGIMGILYIILKSMTVVLSLQSDKNFIKLVENTINFISSLQTMTGNIPSSLDSEARHPDDELVHWCHGAPGAIPLFILANEMFKDQKYLDIALKCGECVWNKGLLKKGFGLCHGISGNAYSLHCLYRKTKDEKWLKRAQSFILQMENEQVLQEIAEYPYSGQKKQGSPDRPYSLMEGLGGQIVCLADFLSENVRFPCYEV